MYCKNNGVPFNPYSVHLSSPLSFVADQFCHFLDVPLEVVEKTPSPFARRSIHLAM